MPEKATTTTESATEVAEAVQERTEETAATTEANPAPVATERKRTVVLAGEEQGANETEPLTRLREKYAGKVQFLSNDPYVLLDGLAETCIEQQERIKGLTADAEYGRQARDTLLEKLDESVVRAFGATNAETNRARYRRMAAVEDMTGVQALIDDLERKGADRLPAGQITMLKPPTSDSEQETRTPAKHVL